MATFQNKYQRIELPDGWGDPVGGVATPAGGRGGDGSGTGTPEVTGAERVRLLTLGRDAADKLVALDKGGTFVHRYTKDGVDVAYTQDENSGVVIVRGHTVLPAASVAFTSVRRTGAAPSASDTAATSAASAKAGAGAGAGAGGSDDASGSSTGAPAAGSVSQAICNMQCPHGSAPFAAFLSLVDAMFLDGRTVCSVEGRGGARDGAGNVTRAPQLPFSCVRWSAFAVPWPLCTRDFVFVEYTDRLADGSFVAASVSVDLPQCPHLVQKPYGYVRAELGPSGYLWRDLPSGDIDLTYIVQVDAKGNVPVFVQNIVAPEQAMNVLRIRAALAQVADANRLLDAAGGTLGVPATAQSEATAPTAPAAAALASTDASSGPAETGPAEPGADSGAASGGAGCDEAARASGAAGGTTDDAVAGAGAGAGARAGAGAGGCDAGAGCQCPTFAVTSDARAVLVAARQVQEVTVTVPPLCSHCRTLSGDTLSGDTLSGDTRAPVVLEFEALPVGYDIGVALSMDTSGRQLAPGSDAGTRQWHGQAVRRCKADTLVSGHVVLVPAPALDAAAAAGSGKTAARTTATPSATAAGDDRVGKRGALAAEYDAAIRVADAVVTLRLDNTHSRFRSKTVMYRLRLRRDRAAAAGARV